MTTITTSPEDYLANLDDDWRRPVLKEIRELVTKYGPALDEAIAYKMLSYSDPNGTPFYLNVQKNHVGLYVDNADAIDTDGSLLAGLSVGKGCIRFRKSDVVQETHIEEFIKRTLVLWAKK
jgi:uncharacterized protein YdhG (YjbR/CyaY superfamily)